MYLKKLHLVNFKNFEAWEGEFSPSINSFTGENGVGKTNILDAIYYLCFTKSYFSSTDVQNIRHDESFMMLSGTFEGEDSLRSDVLMSLNRGSRKIVKKNGKVLDRMSDYIGTFPLVIVSPADHDLIAEGSSLRRKFVDGVISQTSAEYLEAVLSHSRLVEMRNALLKTQGVTPMQLDVYDMQMINYGRKIYNGRKSFLEKFIPIFQSIYSQISGGNEKADITYNSIFSSACVEEELRASRTKDLYLGFTSAGVHKDDLSFALGGYPIKRYGSQGQQKTFLTALKLSQFHFMKEISGGVKPILLLDDIFDKLDSSRVEYIIELVHKDTFGQVFITDTQAERIEQVTAHSPLEHRKFHISR